MSILNEIFEACNRDLNLYAYTMKEKNKADAVKRRWEIFVLLKDKGFSLTQIAKAFNLHHTTVLHGLKEVSKMVKNHLKPLSDTIVQEVKENTATRRELYHILKTKGYTCKNIGGYFKQDIQKIQREINNFKKLKQL